MTRIAVIPGPGRPVEIRTAQTPAVEPGGVLLETIAAEVCGTDVHLRHGRLAGVPYPLTPGHVSIGRAIEVGGEVLDVAKRPIRVGQVVTFLDVHETCHRCIYCTVLKATTRCPERKVYGITYGTADGLLGGWSEHIYLKPGVLILPLAEGVTAEQWIGGGCGLPTAVHAVELARIQLTDRVLIQGSGPVGLSACALARLSGAGWVGVIGSPELRLDAARKFGADLTLDVIQTTREERLAAIREATGGLGVDVVIEATGNPRAVPEGCELVRDAGRYVIVGQYTDHGGVELNPHLHINRKHIEIRGCWGSDFSHVWRAMEVLRRFGGQVDWTSLITRRFRLDECEQALQDVESQRVIKAVILPNG